MRKLFIVIVGLLLSLHANAEYVRSVGTGIDFESAKKNAFALAIEIYAGTVVVSEKEVHNRKLVKDEILLYSSGYINDYKLISQTQIGNQVQVILDVQVNTNKISSRILGISNNNEVLNSNTIQATIETYQYERESADKLLQNILNDYPYRAFNIELLPYRIATDNRKMSLVMPYKLSWNYNYLLSLMNVLEKTQDANPRFYERATAKVVISAVDTTRYFSGKSGRFNFTDMTHPRMLVNTLYDSELRIMGKVIDKKNKVAWYICHNPIFLSGYKPAFYSSGDASNVALFGTIVEEDEVKLDIGPDLYTILKDAFKVQLQIVRYTDC